MLILCFYIVTLFFIASIIVSKYTSVKCQSKMCLIGKTAIVTGGNSGIGYEVCIDLASRGCRVIIADREDSTNSINKIKDITGNPNILYKYIDLASFKSVRKFAENILKTENYLNILINNAGNFNIDLIYTKDNLQECMQVNYFSHFLLTHLLIDLLKKSAPSRVIFTSSLVAFGADLTVENLNVPKDYYKKIGFSTGIYGNSKLACIIACNIFTKIYQKYNITFNSLHPGFAKTNIFTNCSSLQAKIYKQMCYIWGKNAADAAQTIIFLAVAKEVDNISGKFLLECRQFLLPLKAKDMKFCQKIWDKSEELVKLLQDI